MSFVKFSVKRKKLVRLVLSLIFVGCIFAIVDFKLLGEMLGKLRLSTALLLIMIYILGQLVSASKWKLMCESTGISRPYSAYVQAYFFGMFVNVFGLGTVGGDVARGMAVCPDKGQRTSALASVLADRIHGLLVLAAISAFSIDYYKSNVISELALELLVAGSIASVVVWFIGPRVLQRIIPPGSRFGTLAQRISEAFPRRLSVLIPATFISAFFHASQIFMHVILAREFGVPLSVAYLFTVVPLVNIASALPISFGGLGVREGLFAMFFARVAVGPEVAVAFGGMWLMIVTLVSAFGGLVGTPRLAGLIAHNEIDAGANPAAEKIRATA